MELDPRTSRLRARPLPPETRGQFERAVAQMVAWFAGRRPELVRPSLLPRRASCSRSHSSIDDEEEEGESEGEEPALDPSVVLRWMEREPFESPLLLHALERQEFEDCVVALAHVDGPEIYDKQVYDSLRASLAYLFDRSGTRSSRCFNQEVAWLYRSLDRMSGNLPPPRRAGKDPLPLEVYRALAEKMMREPSKDGAFALLFLVLSWNLGPRNVDVAAIKMSDLSWDGDALAVNCVQQREYWTRHVYANPTDPAICPILALAIYLAIFGCNREGTLFVGSNPVGRYTAILDKMLDTDEVLEQIEICEATSKHFGPRSAQTGGEDLIIKYVNIAPESVSVALRPAVRLPYGQTFSGTERERDQIRGRFLAGLPFEKPSTFATLPPFFKALYSAPVIAKTAACFPGASSSLRDVCKFAVASICYHSDYLRKHLPQEHPVFTSLLFHDKHVLDSLKEEVACHPALPSDPIRPTGIPQYVAMCVDMERSAHDLATRVVAMKETLGIVARAVVRTALGTTIHDAAITETVDKTMDSVISKMPRFGYLGSTNTLADVNQANDDDSARSRQAPVPAPATVAAVRASTATPVNTFFMWGRQTRRAPHDFVLESGSVTVMWQRWCRGDETAGIAPFRLLQPSDMPTNEQQARLADLRFLMMPIENKVRDLGLWQDNPSTETVTSWLEAVKDTLWLDDNANVGRKRPLEQLPWVTLASELQSKRRKDEACEMH